MVLGFEGKVAWRILAGNAVHVAWGWLMFTGSFFATSAGNLVDVALLPDPLYTLSLGANALTLAAFALWYKGGRPLFKREGVAAVAALLMFLGTFLASRYVVVLFGDPTALVEVLAGLLTGMGAGTFLLLWGETLVSLGTRACAVYFAASSGLAALAHIALGWAPIAAVQVIVLTFPLVELVLYRSQVSRSMLLLSRTNRDGQDSPGLPKDVLALGLFFGFSFGAMRGFAPSGDGGNLSSVRLVVSMAFVMAACVWAYFASIRRREDFGSLAYRIALPLVALGFLLLPLSGAWSLAGTAAYRFGYEYIYIVLWALWVFFAGREGASSVWIVACGLASMQVSKLIGFVLSADAVALLGPALDMQVVAGLALFGTVLFAVFSKGIAFSAEGWEGVRPAAEAPAHEGVAFPEQRYAEVAEGFALSPRETDVFLLLIRGYSRARIAKELVVTEETVKSHVKGIYQKMGVHTKQDLIDTVERLG